MPVWATPVALATLACFELVALDHGVYRTQKLLALLLVGSLVVMLVCLFFALRRPASRIVAVRRRRATAILIVVLAISTLVHAVMAVPELVQVQRYTNDAVTVTDCAARQVLQGGNPYKNAHTLQCLARPGLGFGATTPLQAGNFWQLHSYPSSSNGLFRWLQWKTFTNELQREVRNPSYLSPDFEGRFNYPGAAIAVAIPALVLGFRDLVPLYLIFIVAACVAIWRRADPRIRPVVGLLLLGNTAFITDGFGGLTDATYVMLLVFYWLNRERPLLAGLLLGLAAASRQQAWFFVPFLLYLGWRTYGWGDLWRRGGIMAAVFLGFNLQFILMSPGDWLTGVLGPMHDPLFALGVGLVELSTAKILPLWSMTVYGALGIVAFAAAFVYFTRRWQSSPALAMFLPVLPLVFAWRSLHSYFMFLPLLAVTALVTLYRPVEDSTPVELTDHDPAPRPRSAFRVVAP